MVIDWLISLVVADADMEAIDMLMSIADICEYLSVSRRTVYRYMQLAGFPAPAKRPRRQGGGVGY